MKHFFNTLAMLVWGLSFKIHRLDLVWHQCTSKVGKQSKEGQFLQTKLLSNKLYSIFLFLKSKEMCIHRISFYTKKTHENF